MKRALFILSAVALVAAVPGDAPTVRPGLRQEIAARIGQNLVMAQTWSDSPAAAAYFAGRASAYVEMQELLFSPNTNQPQEVQNHRNN